MATRWARRSPTSTPSWPTPRWPASSSPASTDTHLDYSIRAHAAGKAIFCEKPIDMDLARARAAAGMLEGARLFLGFNRRFDPNFQGPEGAAATASSASWRRLQITSNDPARRRSATSRSPAASSRTWRSTTSTWPAGCWARSRSRCSPGAAAWSIRYRRGGRYRHRAHLLKTASGKLCVIANSRRSGFGYDQRIEAYGSAGMIRAETSPRARSRSGTSRRRPGRPLPELLPRPLRGRLRAPRWRTSPTSWTAAPSRDWLCRWRGRPGPGRGRRPVASDRPGGEALRR